LRLRCCIVAAFLERNPECWHLRAFFGLRLPTSLDRGRSGIATGLRTGAEGHRSSGVAFEACNQPDSHLPGAALGSTRRAAANIGWGERSPLPRREDRLARWGAVVRAKDEREPSHDMPKRRHLSVVHRTSKRVVPGVRSSPAQGSPPTRSGYARRGDRSRHGNQRCARGEADRAGDGPS